MRAIVHIGTEKTGSTSIQEFLFRNRKELKKNGFYFLQSAGTRNNRALPAYCLRDDKYDDFFRNEGISTLEAKNEFRQKFLKAFRQEIESLPERIHTVLISSEHFHSRTNSAEEVDNVHKLLSPFFSEIEILCYLRDQVAMCASFYSTAIKSGHHPPFEKFVRNCNSENLYYNYSEMLSNWVTSFGKNAVNVCLFSRDEFLNGDLLDDFTARLDPSLVGTLNKDISVENESLSYPGQVLGIAVNDVLSPSSDDERVVAMRNKCQKIIYSKCKGKGEMPPLSQRRRIYAEFAEGNENVRQMFFPDRSELFPDESKTSRTRKTIDRPFREALLGVLDVIVEGGATDTLPAPKVTRLSDNYADTFRDAALKVEKSDLQLACELMSLAHEIRPGGPFIRKKLDEYRARLTS